MGCMTRVTRKLTAELLLLYRTMSDRVNRAEMSTVALQSQINQLTLQIAALVAKEEKSESGTNV